MAGSIKGISGLVAQWRMNDSASTPAVVEGIGGFNGVFNGTGGADDNTSVHSVPGVISGALNLDGTQDFIALASLEAAIEGLSQGSLVAWIKKDATGSTQVIFTHSDITVADKYIYLGVNASDNVEFAFRNGTAVVGEDNLLFTGDTAIAADTWHFIVLTSDGSTYKLYVDAVLQTLTGSGDSVNNGNWFADIEPGDYSDFLGVFKRTTESSFWAGDIDNTKIFNRALTAGEVSTLYNGGNGVEVDGGMRSRYVSGHRKAYRERYI